MAGNSQLTNEILRRCGGTDVNNLTNMRGLVPEEEEENDIYTINQSEYYGATKMPMFLNKDQNGLKILSLNAQSIQAKFSQLEIYIDLWESQDVRFDVICIQETWVKRDIDVSLLRLPGYNLINQMKTCSEHGGLIIYVSDEFNYSIVNRVEDSSVWEGLFIEIWGNNMKKSVIIGNIYRPPKSNTDAILKQFIEEFEAVMSLLNRINRDVVITGDYNINLLKVHDRSIYAEFLDTMISNSYSPKITFPTRITKSSATLIDNFFCKLTDSCFKTQAGIIFTNLSDHLPYFICIDNYANNHKCHVKYVRTRNNTVENQNNLLQALSQTDFYSLLNQDLRSDPDLNYEIFHEHLMQLKNEFMPSKTVKFNKHRHKKSKWITSAILNSIKYRDNLYKQLQGIPPQDERYDPLKINLNTYNKILKKSIREAKKLYYTEAFEKHKQDLKTTWKLISEIITKSSNKRPAFDKIILNGKIYTDKIDIANQFNNFFINVGPNLANKINTLGKPHYMNYLSRNVNEIFRFSLQSPDNIKKVLSSLRSKESSGFDGISVKFLKFLSPALVTPLTLIINQSLVTGIFPTKLKIAKVIPLLKKGHAYILDNYRPVSLLSAISKLFEKVVYNQLYEYFQRYKLFYTSQYGFRKRHSTEYATLELLDKLLHDIDDRNATFAVYMDLSKAFDTLNHNILLEKLHRYGIHDSELSWFSNYLCNRTQYVEIEGYQSETLLIKTGVPQGSILGPLLFLIYMNDAPNSAPLLRFILYADDTTAMCPIRLSGAANLEISRELSKISDWLAVNQLSLNIDKTKYMLFHAINKDLSSFTQNILIDRNEIERVDAFKFLGLVLNQNVSWKDYTDMIANKISRNIGVLNKVKHFLPHNILKSLYCSMIQSYFNYTILAWGHESQRLENLQKRAIRVITVSKYNAHVEPLLKSMGLLKLSDIFKLQSLKFYHNYIHGKLPEYFLNFDFSSNHDTHQYPTRHGEHIPADVTRTQMAQKCVRHNVKKIINECDRNIIDKVNSTSIQGFTIFVKNLIVNGYSVECSDPNCYTCHR